MARYKSILQFRGSLDGLVFYQLNGVPVVRKKSGFDKNSFKTKDNYARVRENSSEFGHCSKVGKMLRHAVRPFSEKSGNQSLYQSFAKLMTHIKDLDSYSDRGQRSVAQGLKTEAGKKLLANFVFGKVNSVKGFIKTMSIDDKINVVLDQNTEAEKIHLISVLPNYSKYSFERKEEIKIVNGENRFSFEKHFEEEDVVYFSALSRGKEIVAMGFCDDY
jgi:hypothetical protein